ncbi:hypothetical protein SEA_HIBISCUS_26 [Gordonia phage Hibiscus]
MTTPILGWEATRAIIPLYRESDLVFTLDPVDATNGAVTSWPAGAASTLYFYDGDPDEGGTQILTAAGIVEPAGIDYTVQKETLTPAYNSATHFLIVVSMPETPTQESPLYAGTVERGRTRRA